MSWRGEGFRSRTEAQKVVGTSGFPYPELTPLEVRVQCPRPGTECDVSTGEKVEEWVGMEEWCRSGPTVRTRFFTFLDRGSHKVELTVKGGVYGSLCSNPLHRFDVFNKGKKSEKYISGTKKRDPFHLVKGTVRYRQPRDPRP